MLFGELVFRSVYKIVNTILLATNNPRIEFCLLFS
jgi:hypothetical protein